jgi:hypothetical protein
MAIQLGDALRTAMINVYETTLGTSPKLILRTGTQPTRCNSVDAGSMLAVLTLPSDWISSAASGGSVTIVGGPWTGTGSSAGTATHYRLKNSSATTTDNTGTTHEQGSVGVSSEDLVLDNAVIAVGQAISITSWTRTMGGDT